MPIGPDRWAKRARAGITGGMSDDLTYAYEKLGLAVDVLVGVGDYRQRLLDAHHHMHVLSPKHLPDNLAAQLSRYREALSWLPPSAANPEEGNIIGTLREMSSEEYEDLARLVVRLFQAVVERRASGL
jgi:uncharacterized short protein YbdD (DUF466 family)